MARAINFFTLFNRNGRSARSATDRGSRNETESFNFVPISVPRLKILRPSVARSAETRASTLDRFFFSRYGEVISSGCRNEPKCTETTWFSLHRVFCERANRWRLFSRISRKSMKVLYYSSTVSFCAKFLVDFFLVFVRKVEKYLKEISKNFFPARCVFSVYRYGEVFSRPTTTTRLFE